VQVAGQDAWLLDQVGKGFAALHFVDAMPDTQTLAKLQALKLGAVPVHSLIVCRQALQVPGLQVLADTQGWMAKRYDAQPGTTYLLRPDQHVLARWRNLDSAQLQAAMARALGQADAHA
jgi:3-(3-hydroxy-phenyl)propionate hydroxylase